MLFPALFGISVGFSLVAWSAVARYYFWPALKEQPTAEALKPILLLHGFRFLGLAFMIPGVVSAELPGSFARSGAFGDLTTAVLALLALAALQTRFATLLTWTFNIFGTLDLLFAFYEGSRISLPDAPGQLGAAYFLVTALVPLLLITHVLVFRILVQAKVSAPLGGRLSAA